MKLGYIIAILVGLLLIGGCKQAVVEEPEAAPAPAEPVVVEEPEPETVDTGIAEQIESISSVSVDDKVEMLKKACRAGNAGICAALKTKYGIVLDAEEPVAEEAETTE